MNKLYRLGLTVALSLPVLSAAAQPVMPAASPYALRLAVGDVTPPANFAAWLREPGTAPADAWQGRVYRLLQFNHLPTEAQKATLRRRGVVLYDYLPLNAWTASLPATLGHDQLAGLGLRSVTAIPGRWKLAGELAKGQIPAHARRADGQVEVVLNYYPGLTPAQAAAALQSAELRLTGQDAFAHQLTVTLAEADVARLAALPWVSAVEAVSAPGVPENFRGRTDHRANAISTDYGAGRHYDGRGVTVGHGDDGSIGPHIDFQGRVDVSTAGASQGDHGDHVAGIIMGAGNLDPRVRGQATGAFNFYQSYPNNWTQAPTNYNHAARRVRVTNSSYGDGNNTGYTSNTRAVDQQMRQLPYLVHVFSSGNSGTSNFGYGAGAGWGNITGGHKMGKNVLTVGNVLYTDALASSSSRGPANDGRIKPDICAVGTGVLSTIAPNSYAAFTGTSMACPGVAGVTAQLVGAYRSLNGGAEAPGALLKAVLLNTAEDLGNPGPDFRFGYGRINALRAVRALEGRHYFRDTLTQGQSRSFTIPVPAGKKQLRVLLHWADYEAAVNARPALVNNLDLTGANLDQAASPVLLPWILDHRATVAQLNANAVRGRDSINNTEQITIDNPSSALGYRFTVSGRAVPQGRQGFWLTYSFVEAGVELTYPLGGEGFVPGETEVIRWDAPDNTLPFALEYSTNDGQTYTPIASNIAGSLRYYEWVVPAGISAGRVKVRVHRGSDQSESPANFTIAPLPTSLRVDYSCPSETRLSWTASAGATSYTVYKLGAMYMDSVTTVSTTFAVLPGVSSTTGQWFSVCARNAADLRSRRTRALYRAPGVRNCPGPPLVGFASSLRTTCPGSTVTLRDTSQLAPASWLWSISPSTGVTFVGGTSATSQHPQVLFVNPGTYSVTLTAANTFGPATATQANFVHVTHGLPLAFSENFNATTPAFPPPGWRVENPSSSYTWQLSPATVMGPDNVRRRLPMANNYDDVLVGSEDYLIAPPLNLAGSTSPELRFALAYQPSSASEQDGLRVDISTDCGTTFRPTGFLKRGMDLATVPGFGGRFAPTAASQWREETVNLRPFLVAGAPATQPQTVLLRFVNINGFGNNQYLANIRVDERQTTALASGTVPATLLQASPVPFGTRLHVTLNATATTAGTLELLDALGRPVLRQSLELRSGSPQQVLLNTEALASGMYVLRLLTSSGSQQLKVVK